MLLLLKTPIYLKKTKERRVYLREKQHDHFKAVFLQHRRVQHLKSNPKSQPKMQFHRMEGCVAHQHLEKYNWIPFSESLQLLKKSRKASWVVLSTKDNPSRRGPKGESYNRTVLLLALMAHPLLTIRLDFVTVMNKYPQLLFISLTSHHLHLLGKHRDLFLSAT